MDPKVVRRSVTFSIFAYYINKNGVSLQIMIAYEGHGYHGDNGQYGANRNGQTVTQETKPNLPTQPIKPIEQ
jgi:hypothetical protein